MLIESCLSNIPLDYMSLFKMPKSMIGGWTVYAGIFCGKDDGTIRDYI